MEITPQNTAKKKIIIIVGLIVLGIAAYLLVNSGFFKGALFVDESLKARKIISDNTTIEQEVKLKDKITLNCDVVIVGAGTGGISAAIASAREGAETCLVEETDWLGGMLTAAGVSAIDGRPDTPSGIFHEIIKKIEEYYAYQGRQNEIHNCSISYLCFEPLVGDYVIKEIVKNEKNLQIFYNSKINKVFREGNKVIGVGFIQGADEYIVNADVTIDATEYGDLMYLGDIPYDLGMDTESLEPLAQLADQCIQPLTFVAILKRQSTPSVIDMPPNYDRENYRCTIKSSLCPESNSLFDKDRLLSYGRMPDGKLMINIPSHSYGNDFHATTDNLENYSRRDILEQAKDYSRGFIYFMQTELGMGNYALYNEFNTQDSFAKMPYIRESRRLKGVKRLTEFEVVKSGGGQRAPLVEDAIAIGDYPIDLHFCKYGKGDIFKPIAPYQIPYSVTIPKTIDGFLAADKNISVSHIVNGTTRLQPVTMAVGQAVGTAAAMASKQGIEPRNVDIHELQNKLIENGGNLFFFKDLSAQHWAYKYLARLAIKGLVSGYDDFTFKPNNPVNESDLLKIFKVFLTLRNQDTQILNSINLMEGSTSSVIRSDVIYYLYQILETTGKLPAPNGNTIYFNDIQEGTAFYEKIKVLASMNIVDDKNPNFRPNDKLTRSEAIVFLGRALDIIFPNE